MSHVIRFAALLSAASVLMLRGQVPSVLNYQGRLTDGTNLVTGPVALSLRLYDAATLGTKLYEDSNTIVAVDGLYSTQIGDQTNFGALATALTNAQVWVEVAVNGNPLVPRERIVSVAYAHRTALAEGVAPASITASMLATGSVKATHLAAGAVSNAALGLASVTGSNLVAGTIGPTQLNIASFSTTFWKTDGNTGTVEGTHYVGTADSRPLDLRVNGVRGLRLQYTEIPGFNGINVIGGAPVNAIGTNLISATVAGGGSAGFPNLATDHGGSVGGGAGNIAGNNNAIPDDATSATVGGGENNQAGESWTVVAGGRTNFAGGNYATVSGGRGNRAVGIAATVAGGWGNSATGDYSMVAGGRDNFAGGPSSLAGGNRAKALHGGTFVWADDTAADLNTTASNQFLIRASGGVGIGTNAPVGTLHVNGPVVLGNGLVPTSGNATNILNLLVGLNTNGQRNGIAFHELSSGFGMSIGYDGTGTGDENALLIYNSTGSPVLRAESGGNIAIGVTNANARLHVGGGDSLTPVLRVAGSPETTTGAVGAAVFIAAGAGGSGGQGGGIQIVAGNGGAGIFGGGGGNLQLLGGTAAFPGLGGSVTIAGGISYFPGNVLIAVDTNGAPMGRVGLGTASPLAPLHIVGDTNVATLLLAANQAANGGSARLLMTEDDDGTYGMGIVYDGGSNQLRVIGFSLSTTTTPLLVVNRDNGQVGIGTLALSNHLLSVGGSIHAEEVVVDTGWADYVFAKDYPLPALDEVRRHIAAHGHLPGIPAAATVEREGLNVGAMQKLMMQKIEELTLYTLQQQAELDALRREVKALREAARE